MENLLKIYRFILSEPEVAGVYVAVAALLVTIVSLFVGKTFQNKKTFNQKGGKNSQNIQGEDVEVNMKYKLWK